MPKSTLCMLLVASALPSFGQGTAVSVNLSGTVVDSAGAPIAAAAVKLEGLGLTATTGQDGSFSLKSGITGIQGSNPQTPFAQVHGGSLYLSIAEKSDVTVTAYGLQGEEINTLQRRMDAGSHVMELPQAGSGVRFFKVKSGRNETVINALSLDGAEGGTPKASRSPSGIAGVAKSAATAAALYDVITVTKSGYLKSYQNLATSDETNIKIKMLDEDSPRFSFFVTSLKALQSLSASQNGFGGDFRFGETGAGAGLRGADKICATIAERSMPSSGNKGWRAFLSVSADAGGKQVDAINRIGEGPWYDRVGRVFAPKKADLVAVRPQNGNAAIQNDLPNEDGVPNHRPDPSKPADDNHHMVTGSNDKGALKSASATCKDWTTSEGTTANGKPSCGFAWPRNLGGGGGGGGGGIGANSGSNWMTTWDAPGCAAGIEIIQAGGAAPGSVIIGGGGGYGGFYCFALNP